MRAAWLVVAALPACYSPELVRCTVRCSTGDTCPGDMQCGGDHHCHEPGDTASCPVDKLTITVTPAGTGRGLVTAMPSINCPSACSETVDYGTLVSFTATPDAASRFVGWGGACTGADACDVKVVMNDTVAANFALQVMLNVEVNGLNNASGDVTASFDNQFDCYPQISPCTAQLDQGTPVTLVATPANDGFSGFAGWTGDCGSAGTQQSCSITLDRALTAIATFD